MTELAPWLLEILKHPILKRKPIGLQPTDFHLDELQTESYEFFSFHACHPGPRESRTNELGTWSSFHGIKRKSHYVAGGSVHLRTAVQKTGYTKNKALASIRFLIICEKVMPILMLKWHRVNHCQVGNLIRTLSPAKWHAKFWLPHGINHRP